MLRTASSLYNPVWVAATATTPDLGATTHNPVSAHFGRTLEVPPLRRHIEDIQEIAPLLLRQITKRSDVQLSSTALHVLMRRSWPNNVGELRDLIASIANTTHVTTIQPEHLPPECFSRNKRILTRMESTERDTIIKSLTETGGNRSKAARAIGISRATIYRKINEYGIDIPPN